MPEPAVYTIPDAAAVLAVSRSTVYRLIADGDLETVAIRSKKRIRSSAITRYLDRLQTAQRERTVNFT